MRILLSPLRRDMNFKMLRLAIDPSFTNFNQYTENARRFVAQRSCASLDIYLLPFNIILGVLYPDEHWLTIASKCEVTCWVLPNSFD